MLRVLAAVSFTPAGRPKPSASRCSCVLASEATGLLPDKDVIRLPDGSYFNTRMHAPNARNALGPRGAMAWIRYLLPLNDPPVFELRTDSLQHFYGVWFSSRAHQEREEPGVQGTFRVVDDGNLAIHWDSVRPINDGGDRNDERKRRRVSGDGGGDRNGGETPAP